VEGERAGREGRGRKELVRVVADAAAEHADAALGGGRAGVGDGSGSRGGGGGGVAGGGEAEGGVGEERGEAGGDAAAGGAAGLGLCLSQLPACEGCCSFESTVFACDSLCENCACSCAENVMEVKPLR
jgi:hypothetical protein